MFFAIISFDVIFFPAGHIFSNLTNTATDWSEISQRSPSVCIRDGNGLSYCPNVDIFSCRLSIQEPPFRQLINVLLIIMYSCNKLYSIAKKQRKTRHWIRQSLFSTATKRGNRHTHIFSIRCFFIQIWNHLPTGYTCDLDTISSILLIIYGLASLGNVPIHGTSKRPHSFKPIQRSNSSAK